MICSMARTRRHAQAASGTRIGVMCWALAALALSAILAVPASALASPVVPANQRLAKVVADYTATHPDDYVGLQRTIVANGGDTVTFAVTGHGTVSAAAAQRLRRQSAMLDVPADSFDVAGSWYHVQDQSGEWWNATGTWNFRDDYVNGSDPGDASGISAKVPDCWVNDGEWINAWDYQGHRFNGALTRQNADLTSSVYDVDDQASGFVLLTDHGSHTLSFKRHKPGCDGDPLQARYYFEHNQDGGGSWGFSISFAGFGLSYNQGTPPRLQKATGVFRT
jgi:hypothetical protein